MKKEKTIVYIPQGAKINVDTRPMEEPKVKNEKTKHRFDLEAVKKVVGGKYGRSAKLDRS